MNELVIFDPQANGHHPEFIQYLWQGIQKKPRPSRLFTFVVHRKVASLLGASREETRLKVETLPSELEGDGNRLPDLALARAQIDYLSRFGSAREAHWFFLYLNPYLRTFPSNVPGSRQKLSTSGILFSPATAAWTQPDGLWMERLKALNEVRRIRRFRQRANLRKLYVLNDPDTAALLHRFSGIPDGVGSLADPVGSSEKVTAGAARNSSINFLLLGALRPGKGVVEALDAFSTWPPPEKQKITLTIAGAPTASFESTLRQAIGNFRGKQTNTELFVDLKFLSPEEMSRHLLNSHFLLLPYLRPLGSSGLLGHAARERKPVLATREGLIGKLVREYQLGKVFDPNNVSDWHRTLNAAVAREVSLDASGASRYLKNNSVEAFQDSLLSFLLEK